MTLAATADRSGPAPRRALAGLPRAARCLVMGVVNVTPDSFSDGGEWLAPDAAIARGLELAAHGADIIDVGGESTRPGAQRVPAREELRRVLPVVTELAGGPVPVSIDTMRSVVARAALEAGARMVNDVSGGLADPQMAGLVAGAGVPYVVMHWRGHSSGMQSRAVYRDVVAEVREELGLRLAALTEAGVGESQLIIDPGLGFAKLPEHNWALLAGLAQIGRVGGGIFPVLIGASRKGFVGRLLADQGGRPRPPAGRDEATTAMTALAAAGGAWGVRVHAVAGSADAVRVAARWRAREKGEQN